MMRLRHTDEWIGALVLAAVALLLIAALQAGVLRDWFKPTAELRLILPSTGLAGLEVGGDVEILGTKAGQVREIVLDPSQQRRHPVDDKVGRTAPEAPEKMRAPKFIFPRNVPDRFEWN